MPWHGNGLVLLPTAATVARDTVRPARLAADAGRPVSFRFGGAEEIPSHRRAARAADGKLARLLRRSAVPPPGRLLCQPFRQGLLVSGSTRSGPGLAGGGIVRQPSGRTKSA